ncbi:hypothetical protein BGZ94_005842, partial [Podila epigama]
MPVHIRTEHSYKRLNSKWQERVAEAEAKGVKAGLLMTVFKAYGWSWTPIIIYRIAASSMAFVLPELLKQLLAFIDTYRRDSPKAPQPVGLGIILSFGMFLTSILASCFMAQFFLAATNRGIEIRTALIAMVYRKSLRLSNASKRKWTSGEITNHMSVDAERWPEAMVFLPMALSIPFELTIATWLLYNQIEWCVFVGIATIVALIPIQGAFGKFFTKIKAKKLENMDQRIHLMNEVLSGIKIVKLYGWEDSFRERITYFRNREVATLRKIGIMFSFMSIIFQSVPLLIALVTFAVYATVGGPNFTPGDMSPARIFVSVALFGLLNRPIGMIAKIIAEATGIIVATNRIQNFLLAEEISETATITAQSLPDDKSLPLVEIKNG